MIQVAAALLSKEGKYLLCQRPQSGSFPLKWEFPGGKLEKDETPQQCVVREVREELDLDIRVTRLFDTTTYDYQPGCVKLYFFFAEIMGGELNLKVHDQVAWLTPEEILKYDLLAADVASVNKLVQEPS